MQHRTKRQRYLRVAVVVGILSLMATAWPSRALAYDVHKDRLNCPRGTTFARVEINPRQCQAHPKRGIPASRGKRACCTLNRDPSKERCLPFPGCPAASVE